MEPPNKRQKKVLFADSGSEDEDAGGVAIGNDFQLNVNKEYARRFEYNKRREEMVQLENKLGKRPLANGKPSAADDDDEESDSEDSEDEDDAAELVTEALDNEIQATLQAIRSKDPRVYDPNAKFYTALDNIGDAEDAKPETSKAEKPMFLKDYHRQNLLSGQGAVDEDDENAPKTYAQEQEDLKRSIVKEMHSTRDDGEQDDEEEEDEGFLVRKEKAPATAKSDRPKITEKDVAAADQDPETFLSNFMASRAWVPTPKSNFQPLESDDDEEDKKAEQFEEAYNLRFEDPNKLNEVILTHARDTTSKYSVRREEVSGRKRQRELERQRKEAEKQQREEERARLRKLKIEELEAKVAKIKKAAGIKSTDFADEDWSRFLDEGWDDDKWEREMKQRFGEDYYAAKEEGDESDEAEGSSSKKRKLKKPKWDDDIDIGDLIPDFDEEADLNMDLDGVEGEEDEDEDDHSGSKKSKKQMLKDKKEKQKDAKRERRKIEQLADKSLELEPSLLPGSSRKFGGTFRYRESSPVSFGLTAQDILMADDSQLNQYAGLKKLASFRDAEKKKRDHKRLGKKARLREWRKETFGQEQPPSLTAEPAAAQEAEETKVDIREGSGKRRKRKKH
ncbi:KRI1 [Arthroderma uncinatum]|uniref:KRI1 n=1 Tax=Arthroderma uncinatum TaxID=74035 RepID=UPI00144A7D65|nr:KRI1 [Arthroderma uncinatum]KAF3491635.1 KRI1 [Arthroderma uncinatum]